MQAAGLAFGLLGGAGPAMPISDAGAAAGRRGDGLLPAEHRARRDGDRAVDERAVVDDLAQQLPVERAELLRRRRHGGAGGVAGGARRLLGGAADLRAALPHLPHLQGLHGPHRGRAAARASRRRTCTWRRSKRWRARSTRRIRRRNRTSGACRSTRPASRRRSGLGRTEIQGVKTAALLHDIGKLAVPEHILSKPGPLTQEEFQKIRIHPQVGAEIIAAVPFPYPVAPLILSHHERWDGKGYPQGLAGEDIPIGARILTIVDYYDAVTTERPYHKALTRESAIGAAEARSGTRARSAARADVHRAAAGADRASDAAEPPATRWPSRRRERPRLDRGRARAGRQRERVREHRARAPRNLRALRDRAVDGHQPRRLRHDGAHLVEADEDRAVVGLRALPAAARRRVAEVPVRGRRRRAAAAERRRSRSARACRAGSRATGGRSSTPTRASTFEAAGRRRPTRR